MRSPRAHRLVWWCLVLTMAISFASVPVMHRAFESAELVVISFVMYALVGSVVAWRRPENPIGWVFMTIGVITGLAGLSEGAIEIALTEGPPIEVWGILSAWFQSWFWYPLFVAATSVTFLLYPSGLSSPRWRPVLWLTVTATAFVTALAALAPTIRVGETDAKSADFDQRAFTIDNPFSPEFAGQMGVTEESAWFLAPLLITAGCGIAAAFSAALRTRRAHGIEREQMRLFAVAILLVPIYVIASELVGFSDSVVDDLLFALILALVPTACGVAILRYHLYDIDRIVGRTTAYVIVTGVLLATYAVVVTSLTQLVPESGPTGAPGPWAVTVATLAAAALFRPVLSWARRVVARRFNREQYDAEVAVEAFARAMGAEVGPQHVTMSLVDVVNRTVQPSSLAVWVAGDPS